MTPFQEDVFNFFGNLYAGIADFLLSTWCYFFGHKWGDWENAHNQSSLGQHRECLICKKFDYNSQRLKVF